MYLCKRRLKSAASGAPIGEGTDQAGNNSSVASMEPEPYSFRLILEFLFVY